MAKRDLVYQSPEDWLAYYQGAARKAGFLYYALKVLQIVAAAAIPVLLNADIEQGWAGMIASGLGAFIVVSEGVLQLFQFHKTYINFQDAAERIRVEIFLSRSDSGPYADLYGRAGESHRRLSGRVGEIAMAEHARWGQIIETSDAHVSRKGDQKQPKAQVSKTKGS